MNKLLLLSIFCITLSQPFVHADGVNKLNYLSNLPEESLLRQRSKDLEQYEYETLHAILKNRYKKNEFALGDKDSDIRNPDNWTAQIEHDLIKKLFHDQTTVEKEYIYYRLFILELEKQYIQEKQKQLNLELAALKKLDAEQNIKS